MNEPKQEEKGKGALAATFFLAVKISPPSVNLHCFLNNYLHAQMCKLFLGLNF